MGNCLFPSLFHPHLNTFVTVIVAVTVVVTTVVVVVAVGFEVKRKGKEETSVGVLSLMRSNEDCGKVLIKW